MIVWHFGFDSKHERDPILIIDIRQFAQIAVQREDINMVCGGRHQWISALFRRILTGLKKTGAKMVFFAPGNQLNDEPYIFIPKQELAYQSAHDILTRIDKGEPIRQILESKHRSIRATLAVEYNLTKVCKPFGELHYNYVRHNQEIARYANEHKADVLAIISGDSEFLVFDGEYENWPVMEMDWIKLTGIRVSRQAVLDGLKVTRKQLAMVGALAGSAYLPSFIPPMKRFNTKLVRVGPKSSKIVDLAAYVQTIPQTPNGEFDLAFVARDVFGDDYTEEELNTINNGLAVFNLNFKKPAVADPMLRHLMRYDRLLYKLLTDKVFCVQDIAYTDYISVRSKTYADLMCPLMLRILGVLFAETKDTEFTREICMKFTHDELYEVIAMPPWYPPADLHFPFKVLYEDHDNDSNQKWRLLLWTLDVDDSCWEALKSLHKHMVTPVATLMYLVKVSSIAFVGISDDHHH